MTTARKWILTAVIASAAALTAAAAALLTQRESPAPLQTLQSAAEYEAKAAEAHADPPAQTAVTHGSAEDLADLAEIADKLPETGEALGKAFRSFRTALSGESPREKEEASAKKGSDEDPHDTAVS